MRREKSRLEQVGRVHVLTLADPDRRNAIGSQLAAELVDHAAELAADPQARALVVTAEGPTFCAGAALPEVFGPERPTSEMRAVLRAYYECFLRIRGLPFPTFAAIGGAAIGAGLNLALCCDVRIASRDASFGATFAKIGLHPGGGCTYFLVEALGRQRALRILLEGATLDAAQAHEEGLADAVEEDATAAALELAAAAANLEPWLARSILQSVDLAATSSFNAVLEFESWAQAESARAPQFRRHVERYS